MPKVTRKETAAAPLLAVPAGMEIEAGSEQLPPKPNFGALSAQDQAGNKVEFRRVSRPSALALALASALEKEPGSSLVVVVDVQREPPDANTGPSRQHKQHTLATFTNT